MNDFPDAEAPGRAPLPYTTHYHLHGLPLVLRSDRPGVMAALQARLRHLPARAPRGRDAAPLTFTFRRPAPGWAARPQGEGRPVYGALEGEVRYFAEVDKLYIHYRDRVALLCDPARSEVEVALPSGDDDLWPASHLLFTLPFVELLKRRGRYSLHAAGLALGGRGLLLAGTSGSGKSTLTLALVKAGFDFMGDDLVFLRVGPAGAERAQATGEVEVQGLLEDIDVTEATAGFFPELRALPLPAGGVRGPKRQVWPADLYPVRAVASCKPALLVLPRVSPSGETGLSPLSSGEALLELVPNVLLTEAEASQRHLDALGALLHASACYRLETGRDLAAAAATLKDLLKARVSR